MFHKKHKNEYIVQIYFCLIVIVKVGCNNVFANKTISKCVVANFTKNIMRKTLPNLSKIMDHEFVKEASEFSNDIENDIANTILNLEFPEGLLQNSVDLTHEASPHSPRQQDSSYYLDPLDTFKKETEIMLVLYTDNVFNLLNSFRDHFYLLNEKMSDLETGIQVIQNALMRIEKNASCAHQKNITEEDPDLEDIVHKGLPMDCYESYKRGNRRDGITIIQPNLDLPSQQVWCNNSFESGGWTVILKRAPQRVQLDFRKTFSEYEDGFGNAEGEYWIGLKTLHYLTSIVQNELFVHMEIPGEAAFARYNKFKVDDPVGYKLHVSGYNVSSSGGNSLDYHNKMLFSAYDKDRDLDPERSCSALAGGGGFWFNFCYYANPTGIYPPEGLPKDAALHSMIEWRRWKGFHTFLTHFTMMIRPTNFHED